MDGNSADGSRRALLGNILCGRDGRVRSASKTRVNALMAPSYDLRFRELFFFDDFFFGTFLPFWRASDRPIAIACLRLVTFFLLRPLLKVPFLRLRIARSTSFDALFE